MRCVLQNVVFLRSLAFFHFLDFVPDTFHNFDETVQFGFAFALGRFDHQSAVDGEGKSRCVVAEIHQTLGDVAFIDARTFFYGAAFQDQFVTDAACGTCINDSVSVFEFSRQIVCVQDCSLGDRLQPFCSQHADISICDRQNARTAVRSGGDCVQVVAPQYRMLRQERNEMLGNADRTYAGTAAAVRRRESLMQVQVADVCSDGTRIGQADLCIHVGSVHIQLTAASVNDVAHFLDVHFEDTVSGWIGDHAGSQVVLVGFGFCTEIFQVDVTLVVTFYRNGRETALDRTCRIRTVGRGRKQDDVAMSLSDAFQVSPDYAQTCIFAGGPGIRL